VYAAAAAALLEEPGRAASCAPGWCASNRMDEPSAGRVELKCEWDANSCKGPGWFSEDGGEIRPRLSCVERGCCNENAELLKVEVIGIDEDGVPDAARWWDGGAEMSKMLWVCAR
jgi:hypothetical protein